MRHTLTLAAALTLSGCALAFPARLPEGAAEPLPLVAVERSAETKARFGADDGITPIYPRVARYEDGLIRAVMNPTARGIDVTLTNKSTGTVRINWDRSAFVAPDGTTSRVMHQGVRYIDRAQPMPPTVIPAGATVKDIVVPTDRVTYSESESGGWSTGMLFRATDAGKRMGALFTFDVGGEPVEYTFWWSIGASGAGAPNAR